MLACGPEAGCCRLVAVLRWWPWFGPPSRKWWSSCTGSRGWPSPRRGTRNSVRYVERSRLENRVYTFLFYLMFFFCEMWWLHFSFFQTFLDVAEQSLSVWGFLSLFLQLFWTFNVIAFLQIMSWLESFLPQLHSFSPYVLSFCSLIWSHFTFKVCSFKYLHAHLLFFMQILK